MLICDDGFEYVRNLMGDHGRLVRMQNRGVDLEVDLFWLRNTGISVSTHVFVRVGTSNVFFGNEIIRGSGVVVSEAWGQKQCGSPE